MEERQTQAKVEISFDGLGFCCTFGSGKTAREALKEAFKAGLEMLKEAERRTR